MSEGERGAEAASGDGPAGDATPHGTAPNEAAPQDGPADDGTPDAATPDAATTGDDGLLGRIEVIEAQPLEQRAAGFEQLHDELLRELQRSDHVGE